jgi:hypothetical protein
MKKQITAVINDKRRYALVMKIILTVLIVHVMNGGLKAQAPDAFHYQAVVRNDDGSALTSQTVNLRISIHTAAGDTVFVETHTAVTSAAGTVNLQVGRGTPQRASLADVQWSGNSYLLGIEVNRQGTGNAAEYIVLGSQQLLSVPYAKHAATAGTLRIQSPNGKRWKVKVDNTGTLSTEEITE